MQKWLIYFFGLGVLGQGEMCNFELVTREEWGARPPTDVQNMQDPVPYVIIHHTYQPPACSSSEDCIKAMRWMQDFHQIDRKWNDIGYNFVVGGDGKAYTGRGWSVVGAHSPNYNNQSIGISLIGDWRVELPPPNQIRTVRNLIECGVRTGKIQPDYKLFGHLQVRQGTECPGQRLLDEISMWDHFSKTPPFVWVPNEIPT